MKTQTPSGKHPKSQEPYLTITRDNADSSHRIDIIEASSAEDAQTMAIEARNIENGYGAKDDGGFEPVMSFNQDDLRHLLAEMQVLKSRTREGRDASPRV